MILMITLETQKEKLISYIIYIEKIIDFFFSFKIRQTENFTNRLHSWSSWNFSKNIIE